MITYGALRKLKDKQEKFDIIFLDPPYKTDFANEALEEIIKLDLLNEERDNYYRN